MQLDFFLRFASAEQALQQAKTYGFAGEDAFDLPSDGIWHDDQGREVAYYLIDVVFGTGIIYKNVGTDEEPVMQQVPGFHINGRWIGPLELVPDFGEALIMVDNPSCRFSPY